MKGSIKSNIERLRTRVDDPKFKMLGEHRIRSILKGILDVQAELDREVQRARDDADRALRAPYAD